MGYFNSWVSMRVGIAAQKGLPMCFYSLLSVDVLTQQLSIGTGQ